jgi:hypothetical protein
VRLTPPQLVLIVAPVLVTPESSGELVLAAKVAALIEVPSTEKPTFLAAKVPAVIEVPSSKKPAILAAIIKPCEPGTRCQRCNRYEKCDELQHGGLF